jgi:DNA-binding NtrC family response regulator
VAIRHDTTRSGAPSGRFSAVRGLLGQTAKTVTSLMTPLSSPAPRTVLVVEDARDVREFLSVVLEDAGFLVQSAGSVEEALGVLRSGRGVDVVVADYNLGDGTGAELIHQASNEGHLDVKVTATLICTAYRYVELPPRVSLVHKPVDPGELLRVIERALEG